MKVSFYLHNDKDSDGRRIIMCRYSHRGGTDRGRDWRFSVRSGGVSLKIDPKQWNGERAKRTHPQARLINAVIDRTKAEVEQIAFSLMARGLEPAAGEVKREHTKTKTSDTFFNAFTAFISSPQIRALGASAFADYNRLGKDLQEYEKETGLMTLKRLTRTEVEYMAEWYRRRGLKSPTIKKKLAKLRRFWMWAFENDLSRSGPSMPKIESSPAVHVALSEDELARFSAANVPHELEPAKLAFLFLCFTGLRWSEFQRLTSESEKEGVLTFKKSKRRSLALHSVALSKPAQAVWNRFGGAVPKMKILNAIRDIREIAKIAGIDSQVITSRGTVPKWRDISTHTGRRTFATLSAIRGMDIKLLSIAMGHSSVTMTEKYLKLIPGDAHDATREAWD